MAKEKDSINESDIRQDSHDQSKNHKKKERERKDEDRDSKSKKWVLLICLLSIVVSLVFYFLSDANRGRVEPKHEKIEKEDWSGYREI